MKKTLIVGAIVIILAPVVLFLVSPWLLFQIALSSLPDPPAPEITYGEFPFKLEYEKNGEHFVVEDTLICEFAGYGANAGVGTYREWNGRLASGNENVSLHSMIGTNEPMVMGYTEETKEEFSTEVYFDLGAPAYYMGDSEGGESWFPDGSFVVKHKGKVCFEGRAFSTSLLELYEIKLLSWEVADPIQNTFIENED